MRADYSPRGRNNSLFVLMSGRVYKPNIFRRNVGGSKKGKRGKEGKKAKPFCLLCPFCLFCFGAAFRYEA